jgi:Cu-Zn family superoxide dismutase
MPRATWSVSSFLAFTAVSALGVMAGCKHAPSPLNRLGVAYSTISGPAGEGRGTAELWQDTDNIVHVRLQLHDLTPGQHGIHFHAVAKCEGAGATPFSTAGAHYNPIGRQHGLQNPAGPHGGDAPNITVGADGRVDAGFTTDRVTLTDGSTTLFDADGSSIVIHAAPDDQISQPAGNSGARVACGIVRKTL